MSKKMYWGITTLIILIITATVWGVLHNRAYIKQLENDLSVERKMLEDRDKPAEQVDPQELDTSHPDFHIHEDGTPHIGRHDEPKAQYTAPEGAVLKPDFPQVDPKEDPVKAAYKRLEYIKNNPYAWGGVHSPRATELIAELMPPPEPTDHDHGEELLNLMYELSWQGDPRAAEVLIANACDGYIGVWSDALVEIGPPAVPYILPYLERSMKEEGSYILVHFAVTDSLSRIGVQYRDDLGGIVDHIIIPKFKDIAADEDNERYERASVIYAQEALDRLQ